MKKHNRTKLNEVCLNSEGNWKKLYTNYINDEFKNWDQYFYVKMKLKKSFTKLIIKYSKNKKPIIECGCGTGKFAAYMASLGFESYAMDIDDEMVKQSKKISEKFSKNNPVKIIKGDICSIPYKEKFFSVTHSSGVLEHYSNEKIIDYINEQVRVSDYCIFSVPSTYFEKKMLGNERFLKRKEWRKIISMSNAFIIEESGYHYKEFKKRLVEKLKKPKQIFKPIALYTFVLCEKGDDK